MIIELNEGRLHVRFRVNDDRTVELVDFSALPDSREMPMIAARPEAGFFAPFKPRQFLAVQVTGECAGGFHANKHDVGSVSAQWRYVGHSIEKNERGQLLKLKVDAPNGLVAEYCLQTYTGLTVARCQTTLTNTSGEDLGVEYVSSFMYEGVGKDRTGVVSALLLERLGYERAYILDDYLRSGAALREVLDAFCAAHPEIDPEVVRPQRRYMEEFLDRHRASNAQKNLKKP